MRTLIFRKSKIWNAFFFLALLMMSDTVVYGKQCQGENLPQNADLRIGTKHRVPKDECTRVTQNGDMLEMHYTGKLYSDCSTFDSSLERDEPFKFQLGKGQVIKGWDDGLKAMCVGEKRKLTIPSDLGYGDSGSGAQIPGGSTLIFDVELLSISDGPVDKKKKKVRRKKKRKSKQTADGREYPLKPEDSKEL